MLSSRRSRAVAVVAAGLLLAGVAWAAPIGVIGPNTGIQPTGRKLDPVGRLTQLGNFPTGGALTTNGRFLWTLSTGRGRNDIRVVRVAPRHGNGNAGVGDIVQTIPMPGLSGASRWLRTGTPRTCPVLPIPRIRTSRRRPACLGEAAT